MTRSLTSVDSRCSIARSLEVLGQKWTLLIVREALAGRTRYAEFRARLGIAPDVLADRLGTLVEHGILERRAYREAGEREREEYVLTEAGRELTPVLVAMLEWGDEHRPTGYGSAALPVDTATGRSVRLAFVADDGREVAAHDVALVRGPGARPL
ncbi:winged helix-turn-helix transcriptional regulator [Cellulomonas sp. ICMP 17802]|uniref:winged helix-turn-helix transcriptional regulator n=1 Tax=Cellulomonas sp. ICMP 17802 TaxID=3239199 RepID=UPI00351B1612